MSAWWAPLSFLVKKLGTGTVRFPHLQMKRGVWLCAMTGVQGYVGEQVSQNRLPEPAFIATKPQVPALFCQPDRAGSLCSAAGLPDHPKQGPCLPESHLSDPGLLSQGNPLQLVHGGWWLSSRDSCVKRAVFPTCRSTGLHAFSCLCQGLVSEPQICSGQFLGLGSTHTLLS